MVHISPASYIHSLKSQLKLSRMQHLWELCISWSCLLLCLIHICSYHGTSSKLRQGIVTPTLLSGCHQLARLTQSAVIKLCIAQSLPKICKGLQQSKPRRWGREGGVCVREGGRGRGTTTVHCIARLIAIREASANSLATPQVFKELRRA